MTFRAIVDGQSLVCNLLSDTEWADLLERDKRGAEVLMPCCGNPGHPILWTDTSVNFACRQFIHERDKPCSQALKRTENELYFSGKNEIIKLAHANGFEVIPETDIDGLFIDILLIGQNGEKIAFMLLNERQKFDITIGQKGFLHKLGIRDFWLTNEFYPDSPYRSNFPKVGLGAGGYFLPMPKLEFKGGANRIMPIKEALPYILEDRVRYVHRKVAHKEQNPTVAITGFPCTNCGAFQYMYYFRELKTICGLRFDTQIENHMTPLKFLFHPKIYRAVEAYAAESFPDVKLIEVIWGGNLEKNPVPTEYRCPHCQHSYFDFNEVWLNKKSIRAGDFEFHFEIPAPFVADRQLGHSDEDLAHWCFGETREQLCSN